MKSQHTAALAVILALGLTACNKAESPDKVQADVDKATQQAAVNDAKADETRKQAEAQANDDLVKARSDAQTKSVDKQIAAVADQAVTETKDQTKIALAKCESLDGDAQK